MGFFLMQFLDSGPQFLAHMLEVEKVRKKWLLYISFILIPCTFIMHYYSREILEVDHTNMFKQIHAR